MRLIDADALRRELLDYVGDQVASKYMRISDCVAVRDGVLRALRMLDNAATIDPKCGADMREEEANDHP